MTENVWILVQVYDGAGADVIGVYAAVSLAKTAAESAADGAGPWERDRKGNWTAPVAGWSSTYYEIRSYKVVTE